MRAFIIILLEVLFCYGLFSSDRAWIINLINCENFKWIVKIYTNFFVDGFQFFKRKHSMQNIVKPSFRIHSSVLGIFLNSLVGFFNGFRMIFCFARIVWVNSISFRTSKTLAGGQIPLNISEDHTPSLFLYSWVQATIIPQWPLGFILLKFFSLFGFFYPENIYPRMKIIF